MNNTNKVAEDKILIIKLIQKFIKKLESIEITK
jgi:hypothetical protein